MSSPIGVGFSAAGDSVALGAAALALAGQQVNAQSWGRDPAAGPFHVFLSDAVEFYVGP